MGCSNQATNDALHPTFLGPLTGTRLAMESKRWTKVPWLWRNPRNGGRVWAALRQVGGNRRFPVNSARVYAYPETTEKHLTAWQPSYVISKGAGDHISVKNDSWEKVLDAHSCHRTPSHALQNGNESHLWPHTLGKMQHRATGTLAYGRLGYRARVPLKSNILCPMALFLLKQVARDTKVTPRTRLLQGSVCTGPLFAGANDWE